MPFAKLTLSTNPSPAEASHLCRALTDLIASDLQKRHELTSVLIDVPTAGHWTIGGTTQRTAAHLEVCVTAGTNLDAQKRRFMANAMALLRDAFPGLDPATYIIIKALPATDWGYGGRSQADRAGSRDTPADTPQ